MSQTVCEGWIICSLLKLQWYTAWIKPIYFRLKQHSTPHVCFLSHCFMRWHWGAIQQLDPPNNLGHEHVSFRGLPVWTRSSKRDCQTSENKTNDAFGHHSLASKANVCLSLLARCCLWTVQRSATPANIWAQYPRCMNNFTILACCFHIHLIDLHHLLINNVWLSSCLIYIVCIMQCLMIWSRSSGINECKYLVRFMSSFTSWWGSAEKQWTDAQRIMGYRGLQKICWLCLQTGTKESCISLLYWTNIST